MQHALMSGKSRNSSDFSGTAEAGSHLHKHCVHCTKVSNHNRRSANDPAYPIPKFKLMENTMRLILSAFALALAAAPVAVSAQTEESVVTVRIGFADIDLTSAQGRAAFEARVENAAREACTQQTATRYSHGRNIVDEKCVAEARTAARAEVERVAATKTRNGREVAAN
jgi:UrcA family protein